MQCLYVSEQVYLGLFATVHGGKSGYCKHGQDGEEQWLGIPPQQRECPHKTQVEKGPAQPDTHSHVVGQVYLGIRVVNYKCQWNFLSLSTRRTSVCFACFHLHTSSVFFLHCRSGWHSGKNVLNTAIFLVMTHPSEK